MKRALVVFAAFVSVSLLGCGGQATGAESETPAEEGSTVSQSSCTYRPCSDFQGACPPGFAALCCDGEVESRCDCPSGAWSCW